MQRSAISAWGLVLAAGACLVLAAAFQPALRSLSPRLAVDRSYEGAQPKWEISGAVGVTERSDHLDPWGNVFLRRWRAVRRDLGPGVPPSVGITGTIYSSGPNGRDEGGGGDDLSPLPSRLPPGLSQGPALLRALAVLLLLNLSGWWFRLGLRASLLLGAALGALWGAGVFAVLPEETWKHLGDEERALPTLLLGGATVLAAGHALLRDATPPGSSASPSAQRSA